MRKQPRCSSRQTTPTQRSRDMPGVARAPRDELHPERHWIDRKIRQGTDAPRSLPSAELAMRVVASLEGAIGYLETNPNSVPSALSVLAVDGKRPTDQDYR